MFIYLLRTLSIWLCDWLLRRLQLPHRFVSSFLMMIKSNFLALLGWLIWFPMSRFSFFSILQEGWYFYFIFLSAMLNHRFLYNFRWPTFRSLSSRVIFSFFKLFPGLFTFFTSIISVHLYICCFEVSCLFNLDLLNSVCFI